MDIENIDSVVKFVVDVVKSGEKEFLRFGENSWYFYVDDSYVACISNDDDLEKKFQDHLKINT